MNKKHRPYLTEQAIFWIVNTAREAKDTDELAAAVYKELAPLALKIDMEEVDGSYITTPRASLMDKLGGTEDTEFVDPMSKKIANYAKYLEDIANCDIAEILDAIDYKEYVLKEPLTEDESIILADSWK